MKLAILLLVLLLNLYAPAELTRIIIMFPLKGEFIFEIVFVWVCYIAAGIIVWDILRSKK